MKTANFEADPGMLHPVDLTGASGDVTVSFPRLVARHNIEAAVFGVIVTGTHETHRVQFDLNGNEFEGDDEASMSAFELGDPASDRREFLAFKRVAGSWYVINDGRKRAA